MRVPCRIVAEVLQLVSAAAKPGVSTMELNGLAESEVAKRGARPAFKGYSGYPYSLCCSVNEQIVHGMPTNKLLEDGDVLSVDFGAYYDGFYGDAAITVPIGPVSLSAARLIAVTKESLNLAIQRTLTSNRLSDISYAVQSFVEQNGFSVVRDFVGHGIGRKLHESPQVPNYGKPGMGPRLKAGMVLAIEPMVNEGSFEVKILSDGWTAVTVDSSLSAHFEHTVAITDNGPEILTII